MSPVERFDYYTLRATSTGCWIWRGPKNRLGYGRIGVGKAVRELAHRFSWSLHRGAIPGDLCVLHKCDTPACVNPDHLFLGTRPENTNDMVAKGRVARGEAIPQHKLTSTDVLDIRSQFASGLTQLELAEKYKVHQSNIHYIVCRKSWRWV
jgi:hypothetical protein